MAKKQRVMAERHVMPARAVNIASIVIREGAVVCVHYPQRKQVKNLKQQNHHNAGPQLKKEHVAAGLQAQMDIAGSIRILMKKYSSLY